MAMTVTQRVTSGLFAAILSAIVVGAASLHFREQSPPPALAGRPAPLDRATLEHRVDELLKAHIKVNRFSGAVLIASQGKPLVAKGYGHANVEWQIPNTTTTKDRIDHETVHLDARDAAARARENQARRLPLSLRVAMPRRVAGSDHPPPAHAYVWHPELLRDGVVARNQHGTEDGRADDGDR